MKEMIDVLKQKRKKNQRQLKDVFSSRLSELIKAGKGWGGAKMRKNGSRMF